MNTDFETSAMEREMDQELLERLFSEEEGGEGATFEGEAGPSGAHDLEDGVAGLDVDPHNWASDEMRRASDLQDAVLNSTLYSIGGQNVRLSDVGQATGKKGVKREQTEPMERGDAYDGVVYSPGQSYLKGKDSSELIKDLQQRAYAGNITEMRPISKLNNFLLFFDADGNQLRNREDIQNMAVKVKFLSPEEARMNNADPMKGKLVNAHQNVSNFILGLAVKNQYQTDSLSCAPDIVYAQQKKICDAGTTRTVAQRLADVFEVQKEIRPARLHQTMQPMQLWIKRLPAETGWDSIVQAAESETSLYNALLALARRIDSLPPAKKGGRTARLEPAVNKAASMGPAFHHAKLQKMMEPSLLAKATDVATQLLFELAMKPTEEVEKLLDSPYYLALHTTSIGKKFEPRLFYNDGDINAQPKAISEHFKQSRAIFGTNTPVNLFYAFIYKLIMFGATTWEEQVKHILSSGKNVPIILYNMSVARGQVVDLFAAMKEIAKHYGVAYAVYSDNYYLVVRIIVDGEARYMWYSLDGKKMEGQAKPLVVKEKFSKILMNTGVAALLARLANNSVEPQLLADNLGLMISKFTCGSPALFGDFILSSDMQKSGTMFTFLINCIISLDSRIQDHQDALLEGDVQAVLDHVKDARGVWLTKEFEEDITDLNVSGQLRLDFLGYDLSVKRLQPPFSSVGVRNPVPYLQLSRQGTSLAFMGKPSRKMEGPIDRAGALIATCGTISSMLMSGACLSEVMRPVLVTLSIELTRRVQAAVNEDFGSLLEFVRQMLQDSDENIGMTHEEVMVDAILNTFRGVPISVSKYMQVMGVTGLMDTKISAEGDATFKTAWLADAAAMVEANRSETAIMIAISWVDCEELATYSPTVKRWLTQRKMSTEEGASAFEGMREALAKASNPVLVRAPWSGQWADFDELEGALSNTVGSMTRSEVELLKDELESEDEYLALRGRLFAQLERKQAAVSSNFVSVRRASASNQIVEERVRDRSTFIGVKMIRLPYAIELLPEVQRTPALQYFAQNVFSRRLSPTHTREFVSNLLKTQGRKHGDEVCEAVGYALQSYAAFVPCADLDIGIDYAGIGKANLKAINTLSAYQKVLNGRGKRFLVKPADRMVELYVSRQLSAGEARKINACMQRPQTIAADAGLSEEATAQFEALAALYGKGSDSGFGFVCQLEGQSTLILSGGVRRMWMGSTEGVDTLITVKSIVDGAPALMQRKLTEAQTPTQ